MIELKEVHDEQRNLLWNIFQKYLYEMTAYYGDEMDENGNYRYEYFDAYFSERERKALLIYDDDRTGDCFTSYADRLNRGDGKRKAIAGFAMINTHSYIGEKSIHVLAEFTVFPMYRRRHIATASARQIFDLYGGKWEVKYSEKNTAAKCLWSKVTSAYSPLTVRLGDDEVVLTFRTMG